MNNQECSRNDRIANFRIRSDLYVKFFDFMFLSYDFLSTDYLRNNFELLWGLIVIVAHVNNIVMYSSVYIA